MCFFLLGHPLRDLPISKPWCLWDLVKDVVDPPLSSYPEKKNLFMRRTTDTFAFRSASGAPGGSGSGRGRLRENLAFLSL